MSQLIADIKERCGTDFVGSHEHCGDTTVVVRPAALVPLLLWLRDRSVDRYDFLVDLCGVDGLQLDPFVMGAASSLAPAETGGLHIWPERFQVVYHLKSLGTGKRLRVKVPVPESAPELDSISSLFASADWAEREVFDMFGIRFRGHPNLKRILCIHTFKGHALRKDYAIKDQQWLMEDNEALMDELGDVGENADDGGFSELIPLNIGPAHPATHGVLRSLVKLDGEVIVKSVQEIGYLHRGFEKHSENSNWTQVVPYTDRLNYCSAMLNNVAYCRSVEKLLGIDVPPRTTAIRVIISEISRIIDHCVCLAACLVDLGALTNFWWLFALRERAYEALEGLCGARLTSTYVRIGGVADDLDALFIERVRKLLSEMPAAMGDVLKLIAKNRIFLDRVKGVGAIDTRTALSHGWTGPCLRATGMAYDLRRAEPGSGYESYDFEIATRPDGDSWSRIMVRFDEMIQSMRIIEQALDKLPSGAVYSDDRRVMMPKKEEVYASIESLMNHFVLVYDGIKVPMGESYSSFEGANGELGFYTVSDGTGRPMRVRCRPPCFYLYTAYGRLIEGAMVPDAVATLGTLNIIAGELDR